MAHHRTLVIPDVHHKYQIAEQIIAKEQPDLTIFLGDYFDDSDDSPQVAGKTAKWLVESLRYDADHINHDKNKRGNRRIHLIGNHDLHYMTRNQKFLCNRYSAAKHHEIDAHKIDWGKLRLYYWLESQDKGSDIYKYNNTSNKKSSWLCTHAGFSNKLFAQQRKRDSDTINDLLQRADKDLHNIHNEFAKHPFLQIGHIRGGLKNNVGGLLWCDYAEFEDIPNTRQIFGHTRNFNVRHKSNTSSNSEHYCIDTVLCNYAICEDYNTMTIKSTKQ